MARLSMSGNVMAQPEDWQSETVRVELAATGKIELVLAPR